MVKGWTSSIFSLIIYIRILQKSDLNLNHRNIAKEWLKSLFRGTKHFVFCGETKHQTNAKWYESKSMSLNL